MLGLKTKTVKARRMLKKLDNKAYEHGVLGATGNPHVQAKKLDKKTNQPVEPVMRTESDRLIQ